MSDPSTLPQPDADLFNDRNEVKAGFIKFTSIGDWFKGTLHEKRQIKSTLPGKTGELVWVYEFVVDTGVFHVPDPLTKQAYADGSGVINLKKGDMWILGGKPGIDNQMRSIQIGQIFGGRFTELRPSKQKGFNPQKVIKIFAGDIDSSYLGGMPPVKTTVEAAVGEM